jgi:hypothetical protein
MIKQLFLISAVFLSGIFLHAQTSAFQISGTIRSRGEVEGEEKQRPRREIRVDEETKVLEMKLRRTNPTVGEEVTVHWGVWIKDLEGRIRLATQGKKELTTSVGVVVELTSDGFELLERNVDLRNGQSRDLEQKVEGYAVWITGAEGAVIGSKFQPSRMKQQVEALLQEEKARQEAKEAREAQMRRQIENRRMRRPFLRN